MKSENNYNPERKPVVIFNTDPGPLNSKSLEEIIIQLKDLLKQKVKEAYIFGSVAAGTYTNSSDIDILLVTETNKNFFERYKDFPEIYKIFPKLDLLIYTPEEFENKKSDAKTGFWKSVFKTAKRII